MVIVYLLTLSVVYFCLFAIWKPFQKQVKQIHENIQQFGCTAEQARQYKKISNKRYLAYFFLLTVFFTAWVSPFIALLALIPTKLLCRSVSKDLKLV